MLPLDELDAAGRAASDSMLELDGVAQCGGMSTARGVVQMLPPFAAAACAAAVLVVAPSAVPPLSASDQPVFRSSVDVVRVNVTVQHRDRTGAVPRLGVDDFLVREDGVVQHLDSVSHEPQAISLAVAVDASGSMLGRRRELAGEAMRTVFSALDEGDELSLVVFGKSVIVPVRWASPAALPGLDWAQWVMAEDTVLYDGVRAALGLMDAARNPQRAVLVISDGEERASTVTLRQLVSTRRQSEVQVFGFLTDPPETSRGRFPTDLARHLLAAPPPQDLGAIVGDSGGVVYSIADSDRIVAATVALVSDLRAQYSIAYTTTRPLDDTYRRLKVETVRRDLRVRHRGGYLAARGPEP